ncbi:MAG TPA: hypothetical protein VMU26_12115 [Candidatus Polarisedimenticolia bacterium]|nr:hypothetical protein [Candidatus Polarisedimenticolia bacterium]
MHGSDKLYHLNAVAPDELTQGLIVCDLAKKLKLKDIVHHSVFRVTHFKDVPHFGSKLAIDASSKSPSRLFAQTTSLGTMHVQRPPHEG